MKLHRLVTYFILFVLVFLAITLSNFAPFPEVQAQTRPAFESPQSQPNSIPESVPFAQLPSWARLVDIRPVNSRIRLDIRYATPNNFLKRKLYPVARCALRGSVAQRLSKVQEIVEKMGLGLKVYDCYRPLSVTKQMWAALPDERYVANPARGSRHNRGAAVDLTLVDRNGRELPMPTAFDDFTEKAYRDYRGGSLQARKNSELLEKVMKQQGFVPLVTEWWHFDAEDWQKFSLLDVPLQAIP